MPSGGTREPTPGTTYSNRSDLGAKVATGQPYGEAGAQAAAQKAVPMGPPPAGVAPGSMGPLDAPTNRPDEPITHGVSSGPGPGNEALGLQNDDLTALKALYEKYPSRDLLRLIYAAATS